MNPGEGFIVYTTEEGGVYHAARVTYNDYMQAAASRKFNGKRLAYIAWATLEIDYDFILGAARDSR